MALDTAPIIRRLGKTARALGVEAPAQRVYRTFSPLARRNHLDTVNLRLLLAFTLKEDSNCIDIGAHQGDITSMLVQLAPKGRHVAVEPLPHLAMQLAEQFPKVEVHNAALAAESGTTSFTYFKSNPELSGLKNRGVTGNSVETIEVELKRLDDIVDPDRPIDFVKIDVEGAELGVLQGGLALLERWRPTIGFEHGAGGADMFGYGPEEIFDLVAGHLGLRIFDIDGGGPYTRQAFIDVYTEPLWFFVAHR